MSKSKFLIIPLLIAMVFILSACQEFPKFNIVRGSGILITEDRPVSGFTAIQLDGAGRLFIVQGDSESLKIRADDNLMANLTAEVQEDTLVLGYREQFWRKTFLPSQPVVYALTMTEMSTLTLNGAADVEIQALETEAFDLEIYGAGNVVVQSLSAEKLSVNLSGAGSVSVRGTVTEQTVHLDGASNYQAGGLQSRHTSIEINGLGQGIVWAAETLQTNINGGGSVSYYGAPEVVQQFSGLGEVRNLGKK